MNFFKSVFTDEPDPSDLSDETPSSPKSPHQQQPISSPTSTSPPSLPTTSSWSLGGLIKTITTKSETVIQTYRRDLEEFGTGLKKETEAIRDAASRAVKDLPASIEVAQESIESVLRGTADIISNSKDSLLLSPDLETDSPFRNKPYSRFESQLNAIQTDVTTYTDDVEDLDDFEKWKLGFVLEEKGEEIMNLLGDNSAMEGIYTKVVPSVVSPEMFWLRYFYKVFKLKQVEDARANLVKRAISGEEEDLSWDVDDDDNNADDDDDVVDSPEEKRDEKKYETPKSEYVVEKRNIEAVSEEVPVPVPETVNHDLNSDKKEESLEKEEGQSVEEAEGKLDEKEIDTKKVDATELVKESEGSGVLNKQSGTEEEDLGWDEIEDLGSGDDKKVTGMGVGTDRSDLRKRLSAADDEEDLNWDIEDDDEPVKHSLEFGLCQ